MRVLITGSEGFIGKNLHLYLSTVNSIEVLSFSRQNTMLELDNLLEQADIIFHLAGINRPETEEEFSIGNVDLSSKICKSLLDKNKATPIIYSSSIQADLESPYGISKKTAENILLEYSEITQAKVMIYRLPNVFGKWCRPNYNSVVATFCSNISQGLPIYVNDDSQLLNLVYIDDLIACWMNHLIFANNTTGFHTVKPIYKITVGQLASQLKKFAESRKNLITENVGSGFIRALYSTYISYLKPNQFAYTIPQYEDSRGIFAEMLKTKNAGQFSFFTAHPGITRGGHYHHSKTEKFLVIKGNACFRFKHMTTGEFFELHTSGKQFEIVETVPGWTHDITNIGSDEMIVMLWANEIFDRQAPDTYAIPLDR